jgi:hypothetical protein
VSKVSKPGLASKLTTALSGVSAEQKSTQKTESIPEVPKQDQENLITVEATKEPEQLLQATIPQKPERALAKSKDPNYKQTSVYFPKMLHITLMAAARAEDKDLSELLTQLGEDWLKAKGFRNLGT